MDTSTLITRNLAEIINFDNLEDKINKGQRLTAYIGFSPTGKIHLGYLIPCMKIRDLTLADCQVAILIADMHAMLDNKTSLHLAKLRSKYYVSFLTQILKVIGANLSKIRYIVGTEFQLDKEYNWDLLQLTNKCTIGASKRAGSEVVKQAKDPKLSSVIYPLMQTIDEKYVGIRSFGVPIDIELGGLDQRKIFCFSKDNTEHKITYLMSPIVSLKKSGKMSASDPTSKIEFTDVEENVRVKIMKAYCCDNDINCGLFELLKCVFFPLRGKINIATDNTNMCYTNYNDFIDDVATNGFMAVHIKKTLIALIVDILSEFKEYFDDNENIELIKSAYPVLQ